MNHPHHIVKRIVVVQLVLGLLCSVVFSLQSTVQGQSAFAALGCVVLPQAYYAWITSRTLNATRLLMHGVLRMVVTGVLMAMSIIVMGIEPVAFFVTFALMQLAYAAK